jgi:hypothetical protein
MTEATAFMLTIDDEVPHPVEASNGDTWSLAPGERIIRIGPADDDTSGQILADAATVDVVVFGDDVEAHSLTLRFPNAQDAATFRRNLLLTGALAGTLTVGSIAAAGAMSQAANQAGSLGAVQAAAVAGRDTDKLELGAASGVTNRDMDKLESVAAGGSIRIGIPASEFGLGVQHARAAGASTSAEVQAREAAAKAGVTSLGASASQTTSRDSSFRGR